MSQEYQYSDFDVDFTKNEFVDDISLVKEINAIRQSITNIILTSPGEKPFIRNFGVGIYKILFELWTPLLEFKLERDIIDAVRIWEPRAVVQSVLFDGTEMDSNLLILDIRFQTKRGTRANPKLNSLKISLVKVR
jgi:phage baseplate assembly protein W